MILRKITPISSIFIIAVLLLTACGAGVAGEPSATVSPILPTATTVAEVSPTPVPLVSATTLASPTPDLNSPTVTLVPSTPTLETPALPSSTPTAVHFTWKSFATGLNKPVAFANAGDGSGRLFVLEQPGIIRAFKDSQPLPTPFLDIQNRVGSGSSEQGLLGMAFDPDYKQNGYFYLDYTDKNGALVVARFKVSSSPDQGDATSETPLLNIPKQYPNHNGGQLAFGPDGYLYIGVGDGGSEGDPNHTGQSLQTFFGKILRIDVHQGSPYAIPADNPFAKGGGRPEIWAYGLRNPWRFFFDPITHGLYIGDVGQDTYEEVDYLPPGYTGPPINFGWSCREGLHPYTGCSAPAGDPFIDPVWEYNHSQGCAIIGGVVYRGKTLPGLDGVYLFGDYCSGNIWALTNTNGQSWKADLFSQTQFSISAFGVDEAGDVFVADQKGSIYQLSM